MPDEFKQCFSGLLAALRAAEAEQKKRYDSALNIEDMSEATAVIVDARTKIQQLRKWIGDLQRINHEVESSFLVESLTSHKSDDRMLDIVPPPITDAVRQDSLEGFTLFGKQYNTSWQELFIKLCETMILKKPYKIASLGASIHVAQLERPIFSLDEQQIESHRKLSNGLFVNTGGSDNEIKTRCEHILSVCGYSSEVLQTL